MKPNRFKQVLAQGKVPVGHMLMEFGTRGIAQILSSAGIDFVLVDMEHSGFSFGDVATLMALFKGTSIAPFVRVPQIEYHFIARCMDAGALGVMVPNVKSSAEARAIVDAVKYAPLGQRGVALGTSNTDFRSVNAAEFLAYANQNTTVICQIESQEGLDNLDEIASTPGVDVLWVGHFDLSHSLGIVGQLRHPRLLDGLKTVIDTARRHNLAAAVQPRTLAQAQEWLDMGFNVMSFGSDFVVYQDALTQGVAQVRKAAEGK
jgi:2-dehydro-3-deoxyglucarate aldolase/4-hydroxy-2-oxoheptanedioate aldolase